MSKLRFNLKPTEGGEDLTKSLGRVSAAPTPRSGRSLSVFSLPKYPKKVRVKYSNSKHEGYVKISKNSQIERLDNTLIDENDRVDYASVRMLSITKNEYLIAITPSFLESFTKVTTICLEENALYEIPVAIFQLTTLRTLLIGYNNITHINPNIGNLTSLRTLAIQGNQISTIPPTISQLTNLVSLQMHRNRLLRLPLELSRLVLKDIRVHENPLISPPAFICIKGFQAIKRALELSTDAHTRAKPDFKFLFTQLKSFSLGEKSQRISLSPPLNPSWLSSLNPLLNFVPDCQLVQSQNQRQYMEDRVMVYQTKTLDERPAAIYAVYDGHSGEECANYLRDQIHRILKKDPEFTSSGITSALYRTFETAESNFLAIAKKSFPVNESGSTACVAVVVDNVLTVAGLGDSRAILCDVKAPVRLTRDHKPDLLDETERIEAAGGAVTIDDGGIFRVNHILSCSRSFGDIELKYPKPLVTAVPEISTTVLTPNHQFMVIASDGLWDVMSDKQVIDHIRKVSITHGTNYACSALLAKAQARKSRDNISILVIYFYWDVESGIPGVAIQKVSSSSESVPSDLTASTQTQSMFRQLPPLYA